MKSKKIDFKQYAILNAYVIKKIISKYISKKASIKWPNDILIEKKGLRDFAGGHTFKKEKIFSGWCGY